MLPSSDSSPTLILSSTEPLQGIEEETLHRLGPVPLTLLTSSAELQHCRQIKLVVLVGFITLHRLSYCSVYMPAFAMEVPTIPEVVVLHVGHPSADLVTRRCDYEQNHSFRKGRGS